MFCRNLYCHLLSSGTPTAISRVILYRYFIALREIYQNVSPEVSGNPWDVIFPDAAGGGQCNISGIPGNRVTNVLIISREARKYLSCYILLMKTLKQSISNFKGNTTPADPRDDMSNVARTVKRSSLRSADKVGRPFCCCIVFSFFILFLSHYLRSVISLLFFIGSFWYLASW